MRSYEASRTIFGLVEALAWLGVIAGGFMFTIGMSAIFGDGMIGGQVGVILMIPGVIFLVIGLLAVLVAQTGRASVDTAELTGQMLKVVRDQLEVSRQALRQGEAIQTSFEALKVPDTAPSPPRGFDTHDFTDAGIPVGVALQTEVVSGDRMIGAETATVEPPDEAPFAPPSADVPQIEERNDPVLTIPAPEPEAESEPVPAEPEPEPVPVDTGPRVFAHKGQTIVRSGADYHVLGQTFADLDAARARVDRFIDERARQRT